MRYWVKLLSFQCRRVPYAHYIVLFAVFVSGCAAQHAEDLPCFSQSEAEIAQAQKLTGKESANANWLEARRLLLSSARCGNPKAPFLLGAAYLFAPEPKLAEGYAWLSVTVDKQLYEATFAKHLMSEIASKLSTAEMNHARQLREKNEHFFGSQGGA